MTEHKFKYHDISPQICNQMAVWPGDVPFERTKNMDFQSGGNLLLSSMKTTMHIGAHADAPNHYHVDGEGIEARSLHFYYGDCQVITVLKPPGTRILPPDLEGKKILAKRVLFKTLSFPNSQKWSSDFVSLSPELIHMLAAQGVILVGIDTPSVDLFSDKSLLTHHAIFEHDLAILEGIVLAEVMDQVYTLVALPLRLKDADASPVRAILIEKEYGIKGGSYGKLE